MNQYELFLFDWDGTLAETLEVWMIILRRNFEAYGLHLTDTEIFSTIGNFSRGIPALGVKPEDIEMFSRQVQDASKTEIPEAPLYPEAYETLTKLHGQGKKLGLITSGWRSTIEVILAKHNLADVFEVVITGDDVVEHKPDPTGILRAIAAIGTPKDKTVMLGDSDKDLLAAKNADIDSILFYPPSHQLFYDVSELQQHAPANVITSWQDFRSAL